jgi:subtilisin family serine protease
MHTGMSERRRALTIVVALVAGLLSLVAVPSPAGATALERQADRLAEQAADGPVRVLVTLDADSRREIAELGAEVVDAVDGDGDVDDVRTFERRPVVAMEATAEAIEALAATDGVVTIAEDPVLRPMLDQTVPIVGADDTTAAGFDGAGFNVAVLDTGVQSNHPFLTGRVAGEACFSYGGDCPGGRTSATGAGAGAPCTFNATECSHGTHVAGIAAGAQVAALPGPTQGVAPKAGIVAVQIFSEGDAGKSVTLSSDILAALDWVYENRSTLDIAAVNLSLGTVQTYTSTCDSLSQSRALDDVIDDLRAADIPTVVASGNDGEDAELAWPACMSNVVSVGASTNEDDVATYANVASFLSLLAPGSSVYSSVPGSVFATKSGTSMATPHVAGAWAAVRDALAPDTPSVTSVLAAMRATGLPIDGDVVDDLPRLDLAATLRPTAPIDLQPSPGADGVTLTWQAPAWSGASAISSYEVTASPAPTTGAATRSAAAGATSFLFDGLTDGVDYTFTVRALNDQGSGVAASTAPAELADAPTAPDAPTGVTASAGDARATVSWTAPDANGSALASYEVTVDPAADVTGGTTRTVEPTATSLSFTGLANGTAYTFTVVAVNAVGPSPASSPSTAVTPRRSTSSGSSGGGGGGSSSGSTTTTTTPVVATPTASVTRLAAADRVATAVEISRARFGAGEAAAVVLTTGSHFADALGGTPFAVAVGGPVLLTPSAGGLADATRAEIRRVLVPGGTVHVLGGTGAVPAAAEDALRSDGFAVARVAGGNRFETAVAVASARPSPPAAIFLADGRLFPDALAGGPAAAHLGGVVLLTDGASLPGVTAGYLAAHPDVPVYALGGRAAAAAPAATGIAGADRYETAALVAQRFFESPAFAGVASGLSFADALGGGADAGARRGPLLLTRDGDLPAPVADYLSARRSLVKATSVYGGAAVVGDAVLLSVRSALGG